MDFDSSKLLYKSSEAAKMLGLTTATLKKLTLSGKIKCVTVNTHRYYTKEQITDYINENTFITDFDKRKRG